MKTFKLLHISLMMTLSLIVLFPETGQAQAGAVVKQAVKQEAKQAAKAGVKQAVKAEIKQAVKSEVKQVVKSEAKQAIKAEMKQAVKSEVKQAVKSEVKQAAKAEVKQAVKAEVKQGVKAETSQLVKKEASATATHTLNSDLKKKSFSAYNKNAQRALQKGEIALNQSLKKEALQSWEKYAGKSIEKKEILRADLQQRPELIEAFNKNPQLMEIYHNFIGSSKYRTDLTLLRYGQNNAGKTSLLYQRAPKRTWLTGNGITLEDRAGATIIRQKDTGRLLGKLEGNIKDGYRVTIHGNSDPALLDLYPMRNTTYVYGNCSWTTDNFGRPYIVKMKANNGISLGGREDGHIGRVKNFKTDYDVNGEPMKATGNKYDDIAGHMAPDSWGGTSCGINIVPQNATMNNSGLWKSSERQGLNLAKQGNAVERTIEIKYPDNLSQRPSSFKITQTVNGKYQIVNGTEMNGVEMLNAAMH